MRITVLLQPIARVLIFFASLLLTACGGDDNQTNTSPPEAVINISGVAEAPGGVISWQRTHDKGFLSLFISTAYAGITGLEPIKNADVILIRIDDNGQQIGGILAQTTTSVSGNYNLPLPSGIDLSGDLVVRIASGNAQMSAIVSDHKVDINPLSHVILETFINSDLKLKDLALNQVVSLTGKFKQLDLTNTPSFEHAINQLKADIGNLLQNEITVIANGKGDGKNANGKWYFVVHNTEFADNDAIGEYGVEGVFGLSLENAWFNITDNGDSTLTFTENKYGESWADYLVSHNDNIITHELYHRIQLANTTEDPETFIASIDSNHNFFLDTPFEEELDSSSDGNPQTAWRYPAQSFLFYDSGSEHVKFGAMRSVEAKYATVDTNNDGKKDALDPNNKLGDEGYLGLSVFVKAAENLTANKMLGNYGMVSSILTLNKTAQQIDLDGTKGIINFDGQNTMTIDSNSLNDIFINRLTTSTNGKISASMDIIQADEPQSQTATYAVTNNGEFSLTFIDDATTEKGYVSNDGKLVVMPMVYTTELDNQVTEFEQGIMLATQLGNVTPELNNTRYKLVAAITGFESAGLQQLISLSPNSELTFDGNQAKLSATYTGFERNDDVAQIQSLNLIESNIETLTFDMNVTNTGEISLTGVDDDETTEIEGYVSHDASYILLRVYTYNTLTPAEYQSLGLMIAIKQ